MLYTDQFGSWFGDLEKEQQDAVIARVDLLEAEGPCGALGSSLRSYIEALGGRLEVSAVFGDEHFPVAASSNK